MKQHFFSTVFLGAVALLTSCNGSVSSLTGGAAYQADKADSYAKAISNVTEKTDLDKFKIFSVRFNEGEDLSNDLSHVTVKMVNPDNYAFTQTFYLDGRVSDMRDYAPGANVVDYEKVKGIDLAGLDPAKMEEYFNEARKLIPEGHTYKSISYYKIEEVLPKRSSILNRGREVGAQESGFGICFTEDGKEYETSGGKVTHLYFEADVQVAPDGTLSVNE